MFTTNKQPWDKLPYTKLEIQIEEIFKGTKTTIELFITMNEKTKTMETIGTISD